MPKKIRHWVTLVWKKCQIHHISEQKKGVIANIFCKIILLKLSMWWFRVGFFTSCFKDPYYWSILRTQQNIPMYYFLMEICRSRNKITLCNTDKLFVFPISISVFAARPVILTWTYKQNFKIGLALSSELWKQVFVRRG